jgi:hypothetical protein
MKNLCRPEIAKYRDHDADRLYGTLDHERGFGGAFLVPWVGGGFFERSYLRVIASAGKDQPDGWRWDHVSVSLSNRTPCWEEMDFIKRLFFNPEEVVMQLHVSSAEHISMHPYCLHLWRPLDGKIPLPPAEMVGVKDVHDLPKVLGK